MARTDEQTNVRLPSHLKDWLKTKAATARRSVTAELILILEESRTTEEVQHEKLA